MDILRVMLSDSILMFINSNCKLILKSGQDNHAKDLMILPSIMTQQMIYFIPCPHVPQESADKWWASSNRSLFVSDTGTETLMRNLQQLFSIFLINCYSDSSSGE